MVARDDDHRSDVPEPAQSLSGTVDVVEGRTPVEEVTAVHDQVGGEVRGDLDDLVQDGVELGVAPVAAADLPPEVPVGGVEHASRHGMPP
nr:hypothetical protein [Actinophytocola gossypii]